MKVMSHIAEGLQKPIDFFDSWFKDNTLSTFRIIHYSPRNTQKEGDTEKLSAEDLKFTTPIHTDSGFLTLLATFNYHGLQIDVGEGVYKSVTVVPKTLVVNLGDMLSRITNYKLKATHHRVLDIGTERYSSPFYIEPNYQAKIPVQLGEGTATNTSEKNFIYGDWLIDKITTQFGEYTDFKKMKPFARE